MRKIVLCGMSENSLEDIKNFKEIILPIKDFINKVVWTVNYKNIKDLEKILDELKFEEFLQEECINGNIVYNQWNYRNDFCRNSYLHSGYIHHGDICINIDTLERLLPSFFENFDNLYDYMFHNKVDGLVLHGKRFLFIYNDFLEYRGTPHEGIQGLHKIIELTKFNSYEDSSKYFINLRPQQRDKYHFVDTYVRYYYSYPNSNHCLLGYENNQKFFEQRELLRRHFRLYCQQHLGLSFEVSCLKNYILNNELDEFMKNAFNQERILNDFYRYHKLNDREFEDRQSWDLIKI